jgi:hypothetical protein
LAGLANSDLRVIRIIQERPMSNILKERRYISRGKVAARFDTTTRTIRRWEKKEKLGFPGVIMLNGRGYFDLDEIESFERRLVRRSVSVESSSVQPPDCLTKEVA